MTETLCVRVLLADPDGNYAVNSADQSRTQAKVGYAVGSTTFRFDMDTNGAIQTADVNLTTANNGHSVTSCP